MLAGVLVPLLLFADDIVLASTEPKLTQKLLDSLSQWSELSGLMVNVDKTFTLMGGVVPQGEGTSKRFASHDYSLSYRGIPIPVVALFKY